MFIPSELVQALRQAQVVPAQDNGRLPGRWVRTPATNLLPRLVEVWQHAADDKRQTARQRLRARHTFQRLLRGGATAALTLIGPWGQPDRCVTGLGWRLAWWPVGVPDARLVAVASSRVQRPLEAQSDWFAAFKAACRHLDPRHDRFLTTRRTTTDVYIRHWASRFHLPLVEMMLPSRSTLSLRGWWQAASSDRYSARDGRSEVLWLSPEVLPDRRGSSAKRTVPRIPLRDRALVWLADRVYVVHVRCHGQWDQLLTAWLSDTRHPAVSRVDSEGSAVGTEVYLPAETTLVPNDFTARSCQRGARLWLPDVNRDCRTEAVRRPTGAPDATGSDSGSRRRGSRGFNGRQRAAPVVALPSGDQWQMLTHCTRAPAGPWPDESVEEFRDALMFDRSTEVRSALDALLRIVIQRRLRAGSRGIRGGSRVVCFTAVPLIELPKLRVYRPHRTRWDFAPYGICICRRWLGEAGAKPVRYGNDTLWRTLPPGQRAWFQKQFAGCRATTRRIDWSVEQEWRHVGDVDLASLPERSGLLFVPTNAEAKRLSRDSPWPVTVLDRSFRRRDFGRRARTFR